MLACRAPSKRSSGWWCNQPASGGPQPRYHRYRQPLWSYHAVDQVLTLEISSVCHQTLSSPDSPSGESAFVAGPRAIQTARPKCECNCNRVGKLLNQDFDSDGTDQKWGADISYKRPGTLWKKALGGKITFWCVRQVPRDELDLVFHHVNTGMGFGTPFSCFDQQSGDFRLCHYICDKHAVIQQCRV